MAQIITGGGVVGDQGAALRQQAASLAQTMQNRQQLQQNEQANALERFKAYPTQILALANAANRPVELFLQDPVGQSLVNQMMQDYSQATGNKMTPDKATEFSTQIIEYMNQITSKASQDWLKLQEPVNGAISAKTPTQTAAEKSLAPSSPVAPTGAKATTPPSSVAPAPKFPQGQSEAQGLASTTPQQALAAASVEPIAAVQFYEAMTGQVPGAGQEPNVGIAIAQEFIRNNNLLDTYKKWLQEGSSAIPKPAAPTVVPNPTPVAPAARYQQSTTPVPVAPATPVAPTAPTVRPNPIQGLNPTNLQRFNQIPTAPAARYRQSEMPAQPAGIASASTGNTGLGVSAEQWKELSKKNISAFGGQPDSSFKKLEVGTSGKYKQVEVTPEKILSEFDSTASKATAVPVKDVATTPPKVETAVATAIAQSDNPEAPLSYKDKMMQRQQAAISGNWVNSVWKKMTPEQKQQAALDTMTYLTTMPPEVLAITHGDSIAQLRLNGMIQDAATRVSSIKALGDLTGNKDLIAIGTAANTALQTALAAEKQLEDEAKNAKMTKAAYANSKDGAQAEAARAAAWTNFSKWQNMMGTPVSQVILEQAAKTFLGFTIGSDWQYSAQTPQGNGALLGNSGGTPQGNVDPTKNQRNDIVNSF